MPKILFAKAAIESGPNGLKSPIVNPFELFPLDILHLDEDILFAFEHLME